MQFMDPSTAAIIAVVIAATSEILPYTPLKGNGILQVIIDALKKIFPSVK